MIDHQTLYPSVPRFIQPIYALEVAILGVKDVLGVASVIDRYITSLYGNVIASSRIALNGDAYCVVFKTWAQTSRFLSDPFTAFETGYGVSHSVSQVHPALLYVLNTNGLPLSARPSDTSSAEIRQLHAQFDLLQQKVETCARAFEVLASQQIASQQTQVAQQLHENAQSTAASLAGLSTAMASSARLQAETSQLQTLQSDARTTQLLLTISPPDRSAAMAEHLASLESQIIIQSNAVTQAQQSLSAANVSSLHSPLFTLLSPLPPLTHSLLPKSHELVPSMTFSQTPTLMADAYARALTMAPIYAVMTPQSPLIR